MSIKNIVPITILIFSNFIHIAHAEYTIDLKLNDKYLAEYNYTPVVNESYQSRIMYDGKERSYYSYFPKSLNKEMPVLVALHGADRTGASMIDTWKLLADEHKFILIAPDSIGREWDIKKDENGFITKIINDALSKKGIKKTQLYLFGHSSGATQVLALKAKYPDKYDGVVAHAGTLPISDNGRTWLANPYNANVALFIGDSDNVFSVDSGRKTVQWLASKGIDSVLYILKNHTHWYYNDAYKINTTAWKFLKQM